MSTHSESQAMRGAASRGSQPFPVVGIGASAGGLKVLVELFEQMPDDCGMAFVVIMHLSPRHKSNADHILQNVTQMPVLQVTQPVLIERDHIYVIPPAMDLSMSDGWLHLTKPTRRRGAQVAIDLFFRTLADAHLTHAIGVVLSGSGSDGSVGLARIKEQGGVTLAQLPADAEYDSMPSSAIETGMVDIVLPVAEMAQKLVDLGCNLEQLRKPSPSPAESVSPAGTVADDEAPEPPLLGKPNEVALREILGLLRARTDHDFRHYKQATVLRRIERRMQVNALGDMQRYAKLLQEQPEETPALLADMLIGVTNFFRDREAFEALEQKVVPALFEQKAQTGETALRIWSAACATGEEAYSLAMLSVSTPNSTTPAPGRFRCSPPTSTNAHWKPDAAAATRKP